MEKKTSNEEETQPRERLSDDSADEADDEDESTQVGPSTSTGVRFGEDVEFLLCTSTSDEDISSEDNLSQTAVKDKDSPPAVLTSSEEDAPELSGNEANAPNSVDAGVLSAYSAGEAGGADPGEERGIPEAQSNATGQQPPSPAYSHTPAPDDPVPSPVQQEESQPPPAPHPSVASSEEDDSEDTTFYSSSDNENTTSQRELLNTLRNISEPRGAILGVITNAAGDGDAVGGSAIARFYSRRSTAQEREGHRIEDRNRMVYERFDESDRLDRRVNEVVRRFENTGELPSTSNYLLTYMRRVRNVARAQELRWVHSMAEDEDSALHSHVEIEELLERVRESFGGAAED